MEDKKSWNTTSTAPLGEALAEQAISERTRIWQRFRRHKLAVLGGIVIVVMVMAAICAPLLTDQSPTNTDLDQILAPPCPEHILGTDEVGRDVWSRLLYGSRISLSVGLIAVSIRIFIGTVLGAIAGYYGGTVDSVLMRLTDVVMCFPSLILLIAAVSILGPSLVNTMAVIGFLGWPGIARLVRGEFLSLRQRDFVEAAHATGVPPGRIMVRHLLPNVVSPLMVASTFGVANAILAESGLSFLGLGVPPPAASWGNMINAARAVRIVAWCPWVWIPPGMMIAIAVLCINFVGDGLRDALDPRTVM